MKPLSSRETEYTDEVEICAGWKTGFVLAWARMFYAYRQKRWVEMLKSLDVQK